MKIEKFEHYIKVTADETMRITNKDRTFFAEYIYLGKGDSPSNYEEVGKEIWLHLAKDKNKDEKIEALEDDVSTIGTKTEENEISVNVVMMAVAELADIVFAVVDGLSSELDSSPRIARSSVNMYKNVLQGGMAGMVHMYVAMIQKGLIELSEVPTRYRKQVEEILKALES